MYYSNPSHSMRMAISIGQKDPRVYKVSVAALIVSKQTYTKDLKQPLPIGFVHLVYCLLADSIHVTHHHHDVMRRCTSGLLLLPRQQVGLDTHVHFWLEPGCATLALALSDLSILRREVLKDVLPKREWSADGNHKEQGSCHA
jgi:hypothetical protein